jgi:SOS-response transcriptional repressor LexA
MAAGDRKLKVFLCHSKDDKLKVRKLYKRLIADGFDAWLDEEKLMPGQDWDLEIRKAVRNSDTVIVCLSNSSTTKEGYIQKEIRIALDVADEKPEGTIFLIPVRLEKCNVPARISRYQWVELFEKSGYAKLIESLHLRMDDLNIRFNREQLLRRAYEDMVKIPILGPISSDNPFFVTEPSKDYLTTKEHRTIEIARSLLPSHETGSDLYALEVIGNGMKDAMINDGDIVVLKPVKQARNGEMVAIRLADEYTLKYFYKEKDRYRLQPANPEMKPIIAKLNEPIEIFGKVVMVIRRIKLD